MNETEILNYMNNTNNDPIYIYIYKQLLINLNVSEKMCEFIIENNLNDYVNIICEYHLGGINQNKLYDARKEKKVQMK